jgi:hypothetical protein
MPPRMGNYPRQSLAKTALNLLYYQERSINWVKR